MGSTRYPSWADENFDTPSADRRTSALRSSSSGGSGAGGSVITGASPLLAPPPPIPGMAPIMVIDDSLVVRRVVEATFARVGIPTISFPDGLSALNALVKREAPKPDLLLLDIGLPKMNGYEVARTMRQHPELQAMIIVMLTGRDGVIDVVRSKIVGARDYIKKPFRPADLVARVCALLRIPIPEVTPDRFSLPPRY